MIEHPVIAPKKLIEVALPLDEISAECVREASPFTPRHPRSLHVWWARRRLAAARAVIFAQLVNDPSWKWELEHYGEVPPNNIKASWAASRKRLFAIIGELVKWENTTNSAVLAKARAEIDKSWRETCEQNKDHPQVTQLFNPSNLPSFLDPFAGGGALPLEAQRLGLVSYASDLNPVAVLINKAMIEIPSKFSGLRPVNPDAHDKRDLVGHQWKGTQGLADDVRYYGKWIHDQAERRIGSLYPSLDVTAEMAKERIELRPLVGQQLTVIAWIWARTVKSPNPAYRNIDVPLVSSFILSAKAGKEAYVEPVIEAGGFKFTVKTGTPPAAAKLGTTAGKRAAFRCLMSGTPVDYDHIRSEGKAGRLGARLMAIVAEGSRGRVYLSPDDIHESAALQVEPTWKPDIALPDNPRDFKTPNYGLVTFGELFTHRQLVALTTFSELVAEAREKIEGDARAAGMSDGGAGLASGGAGSRAYAEAISVYFGLAISRWTDLFCSLSSWNSTNENIKNLFSRQAVPMTWDFAESNPFGTGASFSSIVETICKLFPSLAPETAGYAFQEDARNISSGEYRVISTDPPYYDNIGYAILSDFFYIWLRKTLRPVFPDLFNTLTTPKDDELVADRYRHGGERSSRKVFSRWNDKGHRCNPDFIASGPANNYILCV